MMNEYNHLFSTCEIVAQYQKIKLIRPASTAESGDLFAFMEKIAEATAIRLRKVSLTGQWWRKDSGALLGFYQNRPCAFIPKKLGGYQLIDVSLGLKIKVSLAIASQVSATAFYFYPSLPLKIGTLRQFLTVSLGSVKNTLQVLLVLHMLISAFILIVPIIIGYLFNVIIPTADFSLLWQMAALLVVNIWVITLFSITQTAGCLRLFFKLEAITAPAIWDKMLKLPVRFFRHFLAGDLAFRASVIRDVQQNLIQFVLQFFTGAISLCMVLCLLFVYSASLAMIGVALTAVIFLVVITINWLQSKFMRRFYYHFGQFIGFGFELITGIAKIRVANAMSRVFDIWVDRLAARSQAELAVKFSRLGLEIFISVMTVVSSLVLFGLTQRWSIRLSFADFLTFYTGYVFFFINLSNMAADLNQSVNAVTLWQQSKIVMSAEVESDLSRIDPGKLNGDIVMKNVVFGYALHEQPLFKNLSLNIYSGEFIAIVGSSGSGKSTIFRLMLGLEQPESGEIYYNGLSLRSLKPEVVRRQIGVVIQNSSLIPGTIFTNIVGNSVNMTRTNAWEIAEKIGLADLIMQLPMQMDTVIGHGAITLSGGEAQRLILARALAQKPKIIMLDEATSALDNTTQALVQHYLKQLQATQIIAAHRLSTVMNADRIIVMDKGAIVQEGTFSQLLSQPGLFAQMATRQL